MSNQRQRRGKAGVQLSAQQHAAIDLIFGGYGDQDIADHLKVSRKTISQWRNHDHHFRAEKERRTTQLFEPIQLRLMSLLVEAVDVVDQAIKKGDLRAAMGMLKFAGQALDRLFDKQFDKLREENASLRSDLDVVVRAIRELLPRDRWPELEERLVEAQTPDIAQAPDEDEGSSHAEP